MSDVVYKRLFILLEGSDDKRFFEKTMMPRLQENYDSITLWKYADKTQKEIERLLQSVGAMGADYIYVTDINDHPCVTARKQKVETKLTCVDKDRIVVVVREIEGWYLAGLDDKSSEKIGLRYFPTTDILTKEQFNNLIPKKFDSRIDFMMEILKHFSAETGKRRNKSFAYFLNKHVNIR